MKRVRMLKSMAWLLCLVAFSCQKDGGKTKVPPSREDEINAPGTRTNSLQGLSWQPEGSKMNWEGGMLKVVPPQGWGYVGFREDGKLYNITGMTSKSISCSCNNATGECRPFEATLPLGGGSISGCAGPCTNCNMQQSFSLEDRNEYVNSGGYYAIAANTMLLRDGESAPGVFDALLELEAFEHELKKFYEEAYQGGPIQMVVKSHDGSVTAPKGHCLVAISILGRGMLAVVPESYAGGQLGFVPMSKASCSCDKGTCTLKDKTIAGMGVVYCQGACNTCTLTTTSLAPNITPYQVELHSYLY